MKIQDLLHKDAILTDITGTDKSEVLTLMATFMATRYGLSDGAEIARKIIVRETEMSTGIGFGIAIPHARISGIDQLFLIAGRSKNGIEFNAIDEQPVNLLFMMLSPKDTSAEHTQILSNISSIMQYEEVRSKLLDAKNAAQFHDILIKSENKYVNQ